MFYVLKVVAELKQILFEETIIEFLCIVSFNSGVKMYCGKGLCRF